MKKLANTIAVLATIIAVCFATAQVAGRAVFWQLGRFEGVINTILRPVGVSAHGVKGRWSGINPGILADVVRFPAGEAHGVDFELDVWESLVRNRTVARRLTVADGQFAYQKGPNGWRPRGAVGPGHGNLTALLFHSDEVWLRGRAVFDDSNREAELHVEAMLINEGSRHRFHVTAQADRNCADCALTVDGDIDETGAGAVSATATRFFFGRDLAAILAADHAAAGDAEVALRGDWQRGADGDRARIDVTVDVASPGGQPLRVATTLSAWTETDGYRGRIDHLGLASGAPARRLADGGFRVIPDPAGTYLADLWLSRVRIAEITTPIAAFLGPDSKSAHWLRMLAPHGEVDGFVLRADADGVAFAGRGAAAGMAGYKGVPKLANANFTFGGKNGALRLRLEGSDLTVAFPSFFPQQGTLDRGGGVLTFAFSPEHRGLRATALWGERGTGRARGGLAWIRPSDPNEARVAADLVFDNVNLAAARAHLPLNLKAELRQWLLAGVTAGSFRNGRLVYHGHVKAAGRRTLRRVELAASIVGGALDYHSDWPPVDDFHGMMEVTHNDTRVRGRGRAFDTPLEEIQVVAPRFGERVRVGLVGAAPAERILRFARSTPAREALPFLSDAWSANGGAAFRADLTIPLRGRALRPGDIALELELLDATADLADLGLRFEGLRNRVTFKSPHAISTPPEAPLQGRLFDAPTRVGFDFDDESVRVLITGVASVPDVVRLLNADDFAMARGTADFNARLALFPNAPRGPELTITSDLQGVALHLPPPLGKAAVDSVPAQAHMRFVDAGIALETRYGVNAGWLDIAAGAIRGGAIGIDAPIPTRQADSGRVVVAGRLQALGTPMLTALLATPDTSDGARFTWSLRGFRIGELTLETARLHDVVLDGHIDRGDTRLAVSGRELKGTVAKTGDAPWQLDLEVLRLPPPLDGRPAISPRVLDNLVATDVTMDEIWIGDINYGRWQFGLRPSAEGVALLDIEAIGVRGLDIVATEPAFWSRSGETRFTGTVRSSDVRGALEAWGFAPTADAESFRAEGALRWPGSPFDFALAHVSGQADLALDRGLFLTVEPGAARIMSLVNFSEILRRMRLDFSDVLGQGMEFNEARAELVVDDGLARFSQPARIHSSAASFQIGGTVDLDSGALDNEMIVTVTGLHRNLPWYAAFLTLSNPASAASVLLGSQVLFKDQIKRFSSGKYTIGGTYDDPEVKFVGIWRDDIAMPETSASGSAARQSLVRRESPPTDANLGDLGAKLEPSGPSDGTDDGNDNGTGDARDGD